MQKADKKTSVARPRKSFAAIDLENSIEQPAWPEDGAPRWLHIDPVPGANHSAACDHRDKPGQKAAALSPLRPIAGCDPRRNSCSALFGTRSAGADRPKRAELGQRFEIRTSLLRLEATETGGEANGVWWPPRSSKPLFRRGSVEGLVRFRRASANVIAPARRSGIPP